MVKKIIILMMLIGCVNAYTSVYEIRNINGMSPIPGATVYFENETQYLTQNVTGADGLTQLFVEDRIQVINRTISALGYFSNLASSTISADETNLIFLTPVSTDGIVRFRITDFIAQDREYSVFFAENDRLQGSYRENDTLQVLVNREYIIRPKLQKIDFASAMNWQNIPQVYGVFLIGLGLLLAMLAAFAFILYNIIRKKVNL